MGTRDGYLARRRLVNDAAAISATMRAPTTVPTQPDRAQSRSALPLHIVCPVYHEQDNIEPLWEQVVRHVDDDFVLHFVYDSPDDPTLPVIAALEARDRRIRLVHNARGGVCNALITGFAAVPPEGPVLVMMADLSDDLQLVPEMVAAWRRGATVVVASRFMPGGGYVGGAVVKKLLTRAAGWSLHRLGKLPVRDATNSFRLYDAAFVHAQTIESSGGFEVGFELTAKAHRSGAPIVELPAVYRDRTAGQSNFKLVEWLPHYLRWYVYLLRG